MNKRKMLENQTMGYDIIGDIHGCSQSLERLLGKLKYDDQGGVYRHKKRKVIFLGDFIDRGPHQKKTIDIVRNMIDSGAALAVMGNHEFNAISWFTRKRDDGRYLREHSKKSNDQHKVFLKEYGNNPIEHEELIEWFKTLPLWLDLGSLRVVHACWDEREMKRITTMNGDLPLLKDDLLYAANDRRTLLYKAVDTLLKGKEIPLPNGESFEDKDGNVRYRIRIKWWKKVKTYREAFLGPKSAEDSISNSEIEVDGPLEYGTDQPPVFVGHYWMEGDPMLLASNIACVDYSVAKAPGKLVAYRWNGEQSLDLGHFKCVDRIETS